MATKRIVICDWCDREEPAGNDEGAYPHGWIAASKWITGGYVCSKRCAVYFVAAKSGAGDVVVPWPDTPKEKP